MAASKSCRTSRVSGPGGRVMVLARLVTFTGSLGPGVKVGPQIGHNFLSLALQGTKEIPAVFFLELLLPWACMALSFTLTGRGRGIHRSSGHGCQGLTLRPSSLADFGPR